MPFQTPKPNSAHTSILANMRWARCSTPVQALAVKVLGYFSPKLHNAEMQYPAYNRIIRHLRCNISVETQPNWSWAAMVGTHRWCTLALDPCSTTPHRRSEGYPNGPPKFWPRGQPHPRCQEWGCRCDVSLPGLLTWAMQFKSTGRLCGRRIGW